MSAYRYTNQKGDTFFLHAADVPLPHGRWQRVHYFRPEIHPADAVPALPEGYTVAETRTGLHYLRRADQSVPANPSRRSRRVPSLRTLPALLRALATACGDR